MRVSHSHRYIFLSNIKCASSTVCELLNPTTDMKNNAQIKKHSPAMVLQRVLSDHGVDWRRYTTFTTIRNPWARLLSQWVYARATPESVLHREAVSASTIGDFLHGDRLTWTYRSRANFRAFACDQDGQPLVDFVLRVEDFPERLDPLMRYLGVVLPDEIPRAKATNHNPYREYYDDAARDRAAWLLREDIVVGGYEF